MVFRKLNVWATTDHEPIFCVLKLPENSESNTSAESQNLHASKQQWNRASEDQKLEYNDMLFRKLINLEPPNEIRTCDNIKCNDPKHREAIDDHLYKVLVSMMESGQETITQSKPPSTKNKKHSKSTPGWTLLVKESQETAKFWHSLWISADRPLNTELHKIMKTTRNKYHYQLRKCRKLESFIKNSKLIENSFEDDIDLFKEIKKARATHSEAVTKIDGSTDVENTFGRVYSDLYNKTDDKENLNKVFTEVNANIDNTAWKAIIKIDKNLIKEALKKIKPGKSDPIWDFSSDFYKNAPDILFENLALIIKSFLIHGHVSEYILLSTLVPLVKDKLGDLSASKNYRSIALSTILLKILDWVIIILYGDQLKLDEFQFGFQELSSPNLCSWMALETIAQYLLKGIIIMRLMTLMSFMSSQKPHVFI